MKLKAHPTIKHIFVTPDGRVFKELIASPSSGGYHTVKTGKSTIRRHTLVAETYIGPRPKPNSEVRHKNGNSDNDHYKNLRWGSRSDNMQDAIVHGTSSRGALNGMAKLTLKQAQAIYDRRAAGESGKELAKEFTISNATVCDIYKGRQWPQVKRKKGKL